MRKPSQSNNKLMKPSTLGEDALQELILANLEAKPDKRSQYAKKQKQRSVQNLRDSQRNLNGSKRNIAIWDGLSKSMSNLLGSKGSDGEVGDGAPRRNLLAAQKGVVRSERQLSKQGNPKQKANTLTTGTVRPRRSNSDPDLMKKERKPRQDLFASRKGMIVSERGLEDYKKSNHMDLQMVMVMLEQGNTKAAKEIWKHLKQPDNFE